MFAPFYRKMLSQFFLYTPRAIIPFLFPSSSDPHTGSIYYAAASVNALKPLAWNTIRSTNPQNTGFFVSDDETPYTENIASFRNAPDVSITQSSSSANTDDSVTNTITYTLTNTGSSPVIVRKIGLNNDIKCSSTKGSTSISSTSTGMVFIHELNDPIEIPANGIAVIVLELKQEI